MSLPKDNDSLLLCRYCNQKVRVSEKPQFSPWGILLCVILFFVLGYWSIFLIPFILPLTKAIVSYCVRCRKKVKVRHPYQLVSLKDEVVSFRCGDCALVVSRKYLLLATLFIGFFLFIIAALNSRTQKQLVFIQNTWEEYIQECGSQILLKNPIKASSAYQKIFDQKTVEWQGFVMTIRENHSIFSAQEHACIILMRMEPSQSEIHADLILTFTKRALQENRKEISDLEKGFKTRFVATFVMMGSHHSLPHLHAESIVKVQGFKEIADKVHQVNQRYNPVTVVSVNNISQKKVHNDTHYYNLTNTEE